MPYVKRDAAGAIQAVSRELASEFEEELSTDSAELTAFISAHSAADTLTATDQDFVRVLEDVVELLIAKGVILFTELPQSAQDKIMRRQKLRSEVSGKLDLIGDD
jgi:acyl-coenzyme A synthetase/AMP-(fatty) acid ligase